MDKALPDQTDSAIVDRTAVAAAQALDVSRVVFHAPDGATAAILRDFGLEVGTADPDSLESFRGALAGNSSQRFRRRHHGWCRRGPAPSGYRCKGLPRAVC